MEMSNNGKDLLSQWEGFKLNVYKDSARLDTIGVGHLITKDELKSGTININGSAVNYKGGLTKQQVLDLLGQDLKRFDEAVAKNVTVSLNQNQFDTLVSFSFNIGVGAFKKSTLLKVLNKGQYNNVPPQLLRWNKAGGKPVPGLTNRRKKEISLWNS